MRENDNDGKLPGDMTSEQILNEIEIETKKNSGKKEDKQLRNIFLGLGIFVVLIIIGAIILGPPKEVTYKNATFIPVNDGGKMFYQIKLPVYENGQYVSNYSFYLRTDPRDLEKKVAFNGEFDVTTSVVLNSEDEFSCDGYGIISVANMRQLFEFGGATVIKNDSVGCDVEGKYTYINLKPGEKTEINQIGNSCYDIIIRDCEVLEGTERFMIETIAKLLE